MSECVPVSPRVWEQAAFGVCPYQTCTLEVVCPPSLPQEHPSPSWICPPMKRKESMKDATWWSHLHGSLKLFIVLFPNPCISWRRKIVCLECEHFLCEFVCVPYRDHVLRSDFGELRSWCVCCQRITESTESVQRQRVVLWRKTWEGVHHLLSFSWIQFKQEFKNRLLKKSILTVLGFAGATSTELGQTVFCRKTGTHRGTCWLLLFTGETQYSKPKSFTDMLTHTNGCTSGVFFVVEGGTGAWTPEALVEATKSPESKSRADKSSTLVWKNGDKHF